ncbi:MAG: hypothetical protein DRP47_04175 [Candidatus Zixiibacteriota bacterium]|nr:MAG: hypothetical protein DRP47_04175 [candidate division Zixibacteria bacterium]
MSESVESRMELQKELKALRSRISELEGEVKTNQINRDEPKRSLEMLESLLDAIPDVIGLQGRHHEIIRYNSAGYKFLNMTEEDVQGKKCYELIGRDKACEICATREVYKTKKPAQVERYEEEMGVWLDVRAYPVFDKQGEIVNVIEHLRDITERKKAEKELRKSEENFRSLFETINDFLFILDEKGCIQHINPVVEKRLGYSAEELIGKSVLEVHPPERHTEAMGIIADMLEGKRDVCPIPLLTKEGKQIPVETRATKGFWNGQPALFGISTDITERKQAEKLILAQHELARKLGSTIGLDNTLRVCLEAAIDNSGMDCGGIYLVDDSSRELRLVSSQGLSPEFVEASSIYESDSPSTKLIMAGEPVYVDYEKLSVSPDEVKKREGLCAIAIVPIRYKNQVIACTNIASHSLNEVSAISRKMLETIAAQIGSHVARAKAEDILKESEEKYRVLFEGSPQGILIADLETRSFKYANPTICTMLGYSREELETMSVADIHPKEALGHVISEFEAQARGEKILALEIPCMRKDGTVFLADISTNSVLIGGIEYNVGFISDITERIQTEKALKESEEKLRVIIETAQDSIFMKDLNRRYVSVNPAMEALFGLPIKDILGKTDDEFFDQEASIHIKEVDSRVLSGEIVEEEHTKLVKGQQFTFHVVKVPIRNAGGEITGLCGVARDITEIKRLQELESRAQRLETAGRIAGQVAHDFNNLLAPLMAYPEFIREGLPEDHPVQTYVNQIERAASQIADINQQLLTLGRRGHYNQEPLDLNETVNQILQQIEAIPATLVCELELSEDLMKIMGGSAQIGRVLLNLITNARDAMQDIGQITIRTENYYIDQAYGRYARVPRGEYAKLTITDTGSGISPEILEKIFDPFMTTKTTDKKRGSGLGLSVVDAVVKDHDGYIDVESVVGQGTSFYLYFPVARQAETVAPKENISGGSETLLVVDDDVVQRDVAIQLLTKLGYQAEAVESGEKAIEFLKDKSRDLLILDMVMPPGIDGTETYQRALEINPDQRALIVSGFAESERVDKALCLGVGAFIKKPLTQRTIAAAVRRELDRVESAVGLE